MIYKTKQRFSFGSTSWQGAFGTTPARMKIHYHPKRDRLAARWWNSSFTDDSHLVSACAAFISTGWPPEALDEFLDGIKPKSGWMEEGSREMLRPTDHYRRPRFDYSPAVFAMFNGYWQPKEK